MTGDYLMKGIFMTQAILPEDMEEATLGNMFTGELAYTLPWGMWVDAQRKCWLHPSYPAQRTIPGGTAKMRVELRLDGYHVWPPHDYTWQPQEEPGYVGRVADFIPVAELHR